VESSEEFLNRAIAFLQRSDPIPKLLPQVRLGRMPKDSPALAAIVSSWLEAFLTVLKDGEKMLNANGVLRLDPRPRIAVLIKADVLKENDPQVQALQSAYETTLGSAVGRSSAA
jgi:hypothetical protein